MFQSAGQIVRNTATVLFLSAALWAAFISIASAEIIRSFVADYQINDDGSILVTEKIVYDFEDSSRHGIYRNIKSFLPQIASTTDTQRYVDLRLMSVMREGAIEPYVIQRYDGLSVRIGDANKKITGQHTYTITYRMNGALLVYDDGLTELYWNATGDEWPVQIDHAAINVFTDGSAKLESEQYCYQGMIGATTTCQASYAEGKAQFVTNDIDPGSQMTIAQSLSLPQPPMILERANVVSQETQTPVASDKSIADVFSHSSELPVISESVLFLIYGILAFLVILSGFIFSWRRKYKPNQTIIPQYEPYENFKPMFTGVLFDNKLDPRDLTAGIIYLAQQGFIKITQTTNKVLWFDTTDHEITLLRPASEAETQLQMQVLNMLFQYDLTVGATTRLSDIAKSQSRKRTNHALMKKMKKAAEQDLVQLGFLEQLMNRALQASLPSVIFAILIASFVFFGHDIINEEVAFLLIISIVLLFQVIFRFGVERRTLRGYEAYNHLKGFKDFLRTTEQERYKFHNAPALNPEQFMEYLPYAIAFGVEKEWSVVFKDIHIETPEWYRSNQSVTSFNATSFAKDISAFSSSFTSSSGASSSSSGSRGGGRSGGGGGGGGGGSW